MPIARPKVVINTALHLPTTGRLACVAAGQKSLRAIPRNRRGKRKPSRDSDFFNEGDIGWTPPGPETQTARCLQKPLGVDFGKARVGIATGQLGWLASPLKIVATNRRPWTELALELLDVAQQQGSDGFVVGMPVTSAGSILSSGTDSVQGRACRAFAQTLHATAAPTSLPVFLFDETRTSKDAAEVLALQKQSRLQQQVGEDDKSSTPCEVTTAVHELCKRLQRVYRVTLKGRLDAVAAAMLLEAYFKRPEAALEISGIK